MLRPNDVGPNLIRRGAFAQRSGRAGGPSVGPQYFRDGHLVALIIGMSLSVRFRVVARWTPVRCVLLTIGAAFGYLVLANELSPVIAPIAGLLGALIGQRAAHQWRSRRVRPSPGLASVAFASHLN